MLNLTGVDGRGHASTWPTSGFRPQGTLIYFGRGRRGGGRQVRRRHLVDARGRRRAVPTTWSPSRAACRSPRPDGVRLPVTWPTRRGRCGAGCGCTARRATARCRSAPTTRWSRRPRSCAAWRRTGPRRARRPVAGVRRGARPARRVRRAHCSGRKASTRRIAMLPPGLSKHRLLLHAHHHHADDADGGSKVNIIPETSTSTSTSAAAGRRTRRGRGDAHRGDR